MGDVVYLGVMYITREEIEADMSKMAIESMEELTTKTVRKLANTGLMATELCLIAHIILDRYSIQSKNIIDASKDLDSLIIKTENILSLLNKNI